MTDDELNQIKDDLARITPGPWKWFGNLNAKTMQLATTHSGRRYVMTFQRWGMQGAQPWFQKDQLMTAASDLAIKEVPYRDDIASIDHPDAEFIAKAPERIAALLAEVERLREFEWMYKELAR